jgi:hypothetical protein
MKCIFQKYSRGRLHGVQIFPLVGGGDKAPPEDASAQGGLRLPCREFTP